MNEVIKNMEERRSVRGYKPDMIRKEDLDTIIEAGTYAATGMGMQSPIIVAVTDKATRDQLSAMNAKIMGTDTDPFYGAPVVLIVLADKARPTYLYDGSLVMGNLMNAAHSLGIGSCWIHRAKEEFESVIDFMKEVKFDRLGVFTYSPEEGTPACRMDGQIDEEIKAQRKESIMEAQMEISAELGQKFVGKTLEVIVEGKIEDEDDLYCGRSFRDCYEIDGFVFFKSSEELIAGDFYNIKITSAGDYDLIGERVE